MTNDERIREVVGRISELLPEIFRGRKTMPRGDFYDSVMDSYGERLKDEEFFPALVCIEEDRLIRSKIETITYLG